MLGRPLPRSTPRRVSASSPAWRRPCSGPASAHLRPGPPPIFLLYAQAASAPHTRAQPQGVASILPRTRRQARVRRASSTSVPDAKVADRLLPLPVSGASPAAAGAWASGEAGVGSIGALLGRRFAMNAEAAGVPIGASTFLCQRCESILQPGFNCTIRIKNNKKKAKRRKKSNPGQNNVVYACHFCGDENLIRGSGKGIVKSLLSSRKPVSTSIMLKGVNMPTVTTKKGIEHSVTAASQLESSHRMMDFDLIVVPLLAGSLEVTASQLEYQISPDDSTQAAGSSRKRARKGWTTLKQIAEKDELERKQKMDNFVIPFFMQ
ncbi:hypothetical protein ZWY2020_042151 [Hordeum vulgare]|nr:hypothetical protein ZWY2020_042151 [Hordeum vulgare]